MQAVDVAMMAVVLGVLYHRSHLASVVNERRRNPHSIWYWH